MAGPRRVTLAVVALTAAVVVVATALVLSSPSASTVLLLVAAIVISVPAALSGGAVTRRQGRNRLGPLLALPGLVASLALCAALAQSVVRGRVPGEAYLTAASQGAWVVVYVVLAMPLLFFPDGRLTARADRRLVLLILADAALFLVAAATAPGPFLPPDQRSPHVFGTLPAPISNLLSAVTLVGLPVSLIALLARMVRRYRTSDGLRRRQFRWLLLCALLLPVTLLATWLSYVVTGNGTPVLTVGLGLIFLGTPTVIAVAVLRPDLFDVDRIISTAATHIAATALLLAVFTTADALAGMLFVRRAPIVAVAVTALVAVALAPARGWVQRRVDRWCYPARKAAYAAIAELDRDTVTGRARPEELQERLRAAFRDPRLVVGLRLPAGQQTIDADCSPVSAAEHARSVEVQLAGEPIGFLAASVPVSPELLRDVAGRAAPLIELVRLRVELRRALQEVEESRARLLRVGYEERTRLERDLHDGAQQRLVSLGMALRLAQRRLPRGVDVYGVLDGAVAQLATAVEELRRLAHGIRPSCLDEGLAPALSDLVASTPIPVRLNVPPLRLDPDIETTAYYVTAEAIANAVKHAEASQISVEIREDAGQLRIRIIDDGTGQAETRTASSLPGLNDRVGAHGGRLAIRSRPGSGTVIEAVLPCASS